LDKCLLQDKEDEMSELYRISDDGRIFRKDGNFSAHVLGTNADIVSELNALQKRVEELEKSISKAVDEIEELGKYGEHSLGILHKHGLIGEQK